MKEKISVSIDKSVLNMIDAEIESGRFGSRSHGLEYAARQLKKEKPEIESQV